MKKFFTASLTFLLILILTFTMTLLVSAAEEGTEEPHNYITNGSFEMGTGGQWGAIPGWTMNVPVGTMDLYIGNYYYDVGRDAFPSDTYIALRKEANPDGNEVYVTQTIKNLPVGVYEFSAWMWAATNTAYFTIHLETSDAYAEIEGIPGVRDYDFVEIPVKDGTLTITIVADNVEKNRFMDALADDLKLIKIKGEEAFATPTPSAPSPTPSEDGITESPKESIRPDTDGSGANPTSKTNEGDTKTNSIILPIVLAVVVVLLLAIVIILVLKLRKKK